MILPATAGAATAPTVRLAGSASPVAGTAPRVAAVNPAGSVDFEIDLALPHQAAATEFARAVSTRGSADYGHFLTPAQWEQRFSPTAGQVSEVLAFLRQAGFHVTGVSADRMAIEASGSAGAVERVFATSLSYHRVDGHTLRLADRDLSIPAALRRAIAGISGVSQVLSHPDSTVDSPSSAPAGTAPSPPP